VELIAALMMIIAGAATAVFILIAVAIARREKPDDGTSQADRNQVAASILNQVLLSGGASPDHALRELRRVAGLGSRVTTGIDITSWGEAYARDATAEQRSRLLETAVQLVAARTGPVPLRQYCALLDLSFALGFQTDALARLRERYGFDYIDHAKNARPREADRAGGATPLFIREEVDTGELLRVLEIEGAPTRQRIISAYRRLASMNHPDKFFRAPDADRESAAARFIELTRAYEKLLAIYRD
jgi:hypothetical protein